MDPEGVDDFLNRKLAEITEHFPHVVLLVSWEEGRNTCMRNFGTGNYYARLGMTQRYMDLVTADNYCDIEQQRFPESPPEEDRGF